MHRNLLRLAQLTCAIVALGLLLPAASNAADKDDEYYELMKTFVDTFEQIERNYVKDVDRRELLEAAIRGMVGTLDQYSNFISPEELARFTQEVEQEFGGIGIQVQLDPRTQRLTVISPLPGTPAYKAGVRAGDVIMEIEGKSTEGFTLPQAVQTLKGKAGEPVTIGVQHEGSQEVQQLTIVRDIIHVATVLGDTYNGDDTWNFMLDDSRKLGYIRLTHFSRHSAEELRKALDDLKSKGMRALILDLRFNPGGLLSQATEIADMFIEKGKIVSTKGRNSQPREWSATKDGTYTGFPMAVLVNRYSASASEIVSACLQDHERAIVVGERTWGKGSVQNVIDLDGGNSALKLTTASYHRPSGKNIHRFPGAKDEDEWGVVPDTGLDLKFSTQDMQDYLQYRRDRDILSKNGPAESTFTDKQLAKAQDALLVKLGDVKPAVAGKTTDDSSKPAGDKPATADPKKEGDSKKEAGKDGPDAPKKPEPKPAAEPKKEGAKSDGAADADSPHKIRIPRSIAA